MMGFEMLDHEERAAVRQLPFTLLEAGNAPRHSVPRSGLWQAASPAGAIGQSLWNLTKAVILAGCTALACPHQRRRD